MEIRELLRELPDPEPAAVPRIWRRFRETRSAARARRQRALGWLTFPAAIAAAAAGLTLAIDPPEVPQTLALGPGRVPFGDTVTLVVDGRGTVSGTSRDVVVAWESGTVQVEVTPGTDTDLEVVTDEGSVRVVGTVFSVERDALGVTVGVDRGEVEITCADGWRGTLTPDGGPVTCLPTRPGGLLGRADALRDRGAPLADVLGAVELGLAAAEPGSALEGELLARRIELRSATGEVAEALADAERYLATPERARATEVRRTAARLALASRGCPAALPFLAPLESAGSPEDRVVLASCLAASEPERARALAADALRDPDGIDPAWQVWANRLVTEGR